MKIINKFANIVLEDSDAIVNAANNELEYGSGVCGAIFKAAGIKELLNECKKFGYCNTGDAVITNGYNLKAKFVIHAVGPIYREHEPNEAKRLLISAYTNSLKRAEEKKLKTISFPLISSGIYGYPKELAAKDAIEAIVEYFKENKSSSIEEIRFCSIEDEKYNAINNALKNNDKFC